MAGAPIDFWVSDGSTPKVVPFGFCVNQSVAQWCHVFPFLG